MTNPKTIWHPVDWQRAQQLRRDGFDYTAIADELDMSVHRVERKFAAEAFNRRNPDQIAHRNKGPTPEAEADRERRHQAWLRQSPTAIIMGDPPKGYSALDKLRQKESSP